MWFTPNRVGSRRGKCAVPNRMSQIGNSPAKFLSSPSGSVVWCHRWYSGLTNTHRSGPKSHFKFECSRITKNTRYGTITSTPVTENPISVIGTNWHTRVTKSLTGCIRADASHVISSGLWWIAWNRHARVMWNQRCVQ